jgi:hypothetical protein
MGVSHLIPSQQDSARRLLGRLHKLGSTVFDFVQEQVALGKVSECINASELCISPSDFGFHNAILTKTGIRFIDFEFAGWDDPAKAIVDFNLQPRIPIGQKHFALLNAIGPLDRPMVEKRCKVLEPLLFVKWVCIILSVLSPRWVDKLMQRQSKIEFTSFVSLRLTLAEDYMNKGFQHGLS